MPIASLVDGRGAHPVDALRPPPIPASVKRALADIEVGGGPDDPAIDTDWGEPGLSPAERVFGWNTFEVLAFGVGNPAQPVNAIPPEARAHLQLRFVVGTDAHAICASTCARTCSSTASATSRSASRCDGRHTSRPRQRLGATWRCSRSSSTTGQKPALLPNLGGSLPNDVFADILGLPTVWVPHSYPACSQHAPNEHVLAPVMREGLLMMAGIFWDLGVHAANLPRARG